MVFNNKIYQISKDNIITRGKQYWNFKKLPDIFEIIQGMALDFAFLVFQQEGQVSRMNIWTGDPDRCGICDPTLDGMLPVNSDDETGSGIIFPECDESKMAFIKTRQRSPGNPIYPFIGSLY